MPKCLPILVKTMWMALFFINSDALELKVTISIRQKENKRAFRFFFFNYRVVF